MRNLSFDGMSERLSKMIRDLALLQQHPSCRLMWTMLASAGLTFLILMVCMYFSNSDEAFMTACYIGLIFSCLALIVAGILRWLSQ